MTLFVLIFAGVLVVGSIAAFFLFVPPLLIATVALLLLGFMLMFWLGVQVGIGSMSFFKLKSRRHASNRAGPSPP